MSRLPPVFESDGSHSMRDDFSERARRYIARRDPSSGNAVPVIPLEARDGPWNGSNQLGNAVAFDDDLNNQQSILRLDPWGMPQVWTVSLGLNYNRAIYPAGGFFDVIASIEFGSGGQSQQVEIDWRNGASIALPMNALNVSARYNVSSTGTYGTPTPPTDLSLSVLVTRGDLGHAKPTRTIITTNARDFAIPAFARSVKVMPLNLGSQANVNSCFSLALLRAFTFNGGDTLALIQRVFMSQTTEYLTYDAAGVNVMGFGRAVAAPVPLFARAVNTVDLAAFFYGFEFGIDV